MSRAWLARVALFGTLLLASSALAEGAPFRLDDHLPERLSLSFQTRVRYEALFDRFRIGPARDEDIFVLRTLLHGRFDVTKQFSVGAELMDSRAYGEDPPVSTGVVNVATLLQAYGDLRLEGPFGGRSLLRGGRLTMDVGSRRFVARNLYRNTINAFTGVDWQWKNEHGRTARAFWTLPILRLPFEPEAAGNNEYEFDEESLDVQFFGFHFADSLPGELLPGDSRWEIFAFGLHERDSERRPTRNRKLGTPGFRIWRAPKTSRFDYSFESALQFGESRASLISTRDLDHFAHFHHAEVGYSFDAPARPRLVAQFDYASGDSDPDDGKNGRFDTLFGARRFDFGPTGIYGPFFRANLVTPGIRLQVEPREGVTSFVSLRPFWLANKRDAWVGSGLRDRTGDSGRYLGTQIELRIRWDLLPGNLRLEGGLAHLFAGQFRDDAPLSNGNGDSTYLYIQASLRL